MSGSKGSKKAAQFPALSNFIKDEFVYDSLPEKSREKYNSCYNKFIEWSNDRECYELSEKLILDYFIEMSDTKKPTTLLSIYSMLKQTILSNDEIDISDYRKLHLFLKKISFGYQSAKPKIFTTNDIVKFLRDAPDNQYLVTKVAFILGISGACKSDELCNITMNDIEDNGTSVQLKIRNSDINIERTFEISDGFYRIYRKYVDLRPNDAKSDRLFMKYIDGKCMRQVIGIHKFGAMPRLIASWLKLPEPEAYTGQTFRLTSATLLASSGDDILTIGRRLGPALSNNDDSARKSSAKRQKLSEFIAKSSSIPSTSAVNFEAIYLPLGGDSDDKKAISRGKNPFFEDKKCGSRKLSSVKLPDRNSSSGRILRSSTAAAAAAARVNKPQTPSKTQVLNVKSLKSKQAAPRTPKMQQQSTNRVPQNAEVCLRWNSYRSNMQNSFPSLLHSEEFVDVTLACEGKSVKCHKIILSSCSDYLAQLLRENPCPHPIILMKDLKFWEIEAIVKFMYNGEVNVPHDKLPQFLNAARALQIKGLIKFPSNISKPPPLSPQSSFQAPVAPVPPNPPNLLQFDDKNPPNLLQFNDKSPPNLPRFDGKNSPKNSSSAAKLTGNRGKKRLLEPEEPQSFPKIRLQHPKSSAPPKSSIIKSEPLFFTPNTSQQINDNISCLNDENNGIIHEDDDPGGEEQSDCPENDSSFLTHDPGDILNDDEQIILLPADFLDRKILGQRELRDFAEIIGNNGPEEPDEADEDELRDNT